MLNVSASPTKSEDDALIEETTYGDRLLVPSSIPVSPMPLIDTNDEVIITLEVDSPRSASELVSRGLLTPLARTSTPFTGRPPAPPRSPPAPSPALARALSERRQAEIAALAAAARAEAAEAALAASVPLSPAPLPPCSESNKAEIEAMRNEITALRHALRASRVASTTLTSPPPPPLSPPPPPPPTIRAQLLETIFNRVEARNPPSITDFMDSVAQAAQAAAAAATAAAATRAEADRHEIARITELLELANERARLAECRAQEYRSSLASAEARIQALNQANQQLRDELNEANDRVVRSEQSLAAAQAAVQAAEQRAGAAEAATAAAVAAQHQALDTAATACARETAANTFYDHLDASVSAALSACAEGVAEAAKARAETSQKEQEWTQREMALSTAFEHTLRRQIEAEQVARDAESRACAARAAAASASAAAVASEESARALFTSVAARERLREASDASCIVSSFDSAREALQLLPESIRTEFCAAAGAYRELGPEGAALSLSKAVAGLGEAWKSVIIHNDSRSLETIIRERDELLDLVEARAHAALAAHRDGRTVTAVSTLGKDVANELEFERLLRQGVDVSSAVPEGDLDAAVRAAVAGAGLPTPPQISVLKAPWNTAHGQRAVYMIDAPVTVRLDTGAGIPIVHSARANGRTVRVECPLQVYLKELFAPVLAAVNGADEVSLIPPSPGPTSPTPAASPAFSPASSALATTRWGTRRSASEVYELALQTIAEE